MCGAKVDILQLDRKNGYHVDVDALDALVTDDTKLICINNPDNPTGALLDTDTLKAIVEVARKHDAWVLCDEVYRLLTQTDACVWAGRSPRARSSVARCFRIATTT